MAKGFGKASLKKKKSRKTSLNNPPLDCERVQKEWTKHFKELIDPRGS